MVLQREGLWRAPVTFLTDDFEAESIPRTAQLVCTRSLFCFLGHDCTCSTGQLAAHSVMLVVQPAALKRKLIFHINVSSSFWSHKLLLMSILTGSFIHIYAVFPRPPCFIALYCLLGILAWLHRIKTDIKTTHYLTLKLGKWKIDNR